MAEKSTAMTPRSQSDVARRESQIESPFRTLQRFADEMDSVFDDFGLGRSSRAPRFGLGRSWLSSPARLAAQAWAPDIDVSQQNNELVIRADLPGMTRGDAAST
jgi:HSP20 family protein